MRIWNFLPYSPILRANRANLNFYDVNVADTRGLQHSTEKKTGDNLPIYFTSEDYATLTQATTNRKLKMNQDRGLIVYPIHVTDNNHPAPQHQHDFIIGTFDGHGDMGSIEIPYITRQDKPNLSDEKSRIEQAGGHVFVPLPPKDPMKSSRVITKKENVGLAMSRSIGDSEWSPLGVTAEPIVSKINIAIRVFHVCSRKSHTN